MQEYEKSGYLLEDYKFFHLKDKNNSRFNYHYHDFSKIVILLSGNVSYVIEGKLYTLKPLDVLLVNRFDIHKPIINSETSYERVVIWINNEYLSCTDNEKCKISVCFENDNKLLCLKREEKQEIQRLLMEFEYECKNSQFGHEIMSDAYLKQLIIMINRYQKSLIDRKLQERIEYDVHIQRVIEYVNSHLNEDLTNDRVSEECYISKYYLMHKFKQETGYTLHNYITQKRLNKTISLIELGSPVLKAAENSGFNDYTSFLRAYKKRYNEIPSYIKK